LDSEPRMASPACSREMSRPSRSLRSCPPSTMRRAVGPVPDPPVDTPGLDTATLPATRRPARPGTLHAPGNERSRTRRQVPSSPNQPQIKSRANAKAELTPKASEREHQPHPPLSPKPRKHKLDSVGDLAFVEVRCRRPARTSAEGSHAGPGNPGRRSAAGPGWPRRRVVGG
jgi:hypothetical protein